MERRKMLVWGGLAAAFSSAAADDTAGFARGLKDRLDEGAKAQAFVHMKRHRHRKPITRKATKTPAIIGSSAATTERAAVGGWEALADMVNF